MTAEEKDNLLDRYVAGHPMNDAEEATVRHLLTSDPGFRTEYQLRQELYAFGQRERRAAWEARLAEHPIPVERRVFPMRWAAAASVALLIGIGLIWQLQSSTDQVFTGQAAVFEQRGNQLNLAGSDSAAVGSIAWVVTKSETNQYEFGQADTLRVFATDPSQWENQAWQLIRLSEVRYRLRVGTKTYPLKQGRTVHLPLVPDN